MPPNNVDRALAAPVGEIGPSLLGLREDQWFDRKSNKTSPKGLGPALIAFANSEGGTIVVGLSAGRVEGTKAVAGNLNSFRQAPFDFTVPPVHATFQEVACINDSGEPDSLVVIRVDPSEGVHETQDGACYLRVGDESRKLFFAQRRELEFDKGQSQYDGTPIPEVGIYDLNSDLVDFYREHAGATGDRETLFKARSLLTYRDELTVAGYLLFADYPQMQLPQAYIRILRFLTSKRGTGAELGLEAGSDFRIEGPIPSAIEEAHTKIEELLPRRRALTDSGLFESQATIPRAAWLEGLVNAVIHRSYSLSGDHIRVEIYPDRIEIESPGRFPGLANPDSPMEISRFARNPRISRVCADLGLAQELGEGIKRIFNEMRRVGLTDPVYKQSQGSVRLTLLALPRLDEHLVARLPRGSQRVLELMRGAGRGLSTGDIAEGLDLSRPATLIRLRALEAEELISWSGKSTNDPRAVWLLTEG